MVRTTVATTLMRTPKSAVSVAADLSIARLDFTDTDISHFHVVFFPSQGSSSVLLPEPSAAKMIACVCKCQRGVTASVTAVTTRMS